MSKMKYDAWRKLAVHASDIRPMGIDGIRDLEEPVQGVAFMVPHRSDNERCPTIDRWDNLGYITFDPRRQRYDVQIENTEEEFIDFEDACRYLWDNWAKAMLDPGPRYRLIGADESGNMLVNQICGDFEQLKAIVHRELPDPPLNPGEESYADAVIKDLSRVGMRFSEFPHGHFAAFPLED